MRKCAIQLADTDLLAKLAPGDMLALEAYTIEQGLLQKKSLTAVEEMGNPFLEKRNDLLVLDTTNIVDISVGDIVRKIEALNNTITSSVN